MRARISIRTAIRSDARSQEAPDDVHPGRPAASVRAESFREWLTFSSLFGFAIALLIAIVSACSGATASVYQALPFFIVYIAVYVGSYFIRHRFPATASFLRFFQHLALYGIFYQHLHAMMHEARPQTVDAALARFDHAIFGTDPIAWLGLHGHPLITDALSLAYFSYYLGMPVLLVLMWRRNSEDDFRIALSAITMGWYGALVTYFLFPALGPQRFMPEQLPALHGLLPTTAWIHSFLAANLTPVIRDCVPSMHTGVTLLTLTFAFRFQRRFFWIYLPGGAGLIAATVYLQQHYAVDVILGIAAFLLILLLAMKGRPR